jgi:hypothetical protein
MFQDRQKMASGSTQRVAVFVDGENIAHGWADEIMDHAGQSGQIQVARAYGSEHQTQNWGQQPGFRFIYCCTGKNSADMQLTIDAVDLSHRGGAETFVIASSDSDFTNLAHFLRGRGHLVIGVGQEKASERFRAACTGFHVLESATPASLVTPQRTPTEILSDLIRREADPKGVKLTDLNILMRRESEGFRISQQNEKTWRGYLEARPQLYVCDPKGANARVRLRAKR